MLTVDAMSNLALAETSISPKSMNGSAATMLDRDYLENEDNSFFEKSSTEDQQQPPSDDGSDDNSSETVEDIKSDSVVVENKVDNNTVENEEKVYKYFGIEFKQPFKWGNVISISLYHIFFVITFCYYWGNNHKFLSTLWGFGMGIIGGFGVTGGVHRLWSHRSYKAKLPLRIILMICFSCAGQNSIFEWVRDHRIHHKYSETDADPHNSNRGFFFAHVGWLMMKKHPRVIEKGRQIDMSDILNDPVVQFHERHFTKLKLVFCFILPVMAPMLFWGETFGNAIISQVFIRYVFSLNFTWLVNSAAHIFGNRPYDKRINPSENLWVSLVAMGEGWHNYHHVFPWDYKAAELGIYTVNYTTMFLDFFAKIGWAYDRKEPSKELVKRTIERHGDGSYLSPYAPEVPPPPELDENANVIKSKMH